MPSVEENYVLKEQLGEGSFGSVYKAYVIHTSAPFGHGRIC